MLQSLTQTYNYVLSICRDQETANNYNQLYSNLVKTKDLASIDFMKRLKR